MIIEERNSHLGLTARGYRPTVRPFSKPLAPTRGGGDAQESGPSNEIPSLPMQWGARAFVCRDRIKGHSGEGSASERSTPP